MTGDEVRDALDGCDLDMSRAVTTAEQLRKLLGERDGEPEPDESEVERELRHISG